MHTVTIVGLGQIGMGYDIGLDPIQYVYTHARAFSQNPNFSLILGIDPEEKKREIFRSTFHVNALGSISEIPRDFSTDILVVASHTNNHLNIIRDFLSRSKPKLILCEKPLSYRVEEATEIVQLCEKNQIPLFVNYIRKSLPEVQYIYKLIQELESYFIKGVCYYSKGLIHNGTHFLNLLGYWFGIPVQIKKIANGRVISDYDAEPDFYIEYSNARIQFISVREEDYSFYNVELILPTGYLHYHRGGEEILWYSRREDPILKGYYSLSSSPEVIPSHMNFYQKFVVLELQKFLENKEYNLCSGKEALQTLKLVVGNVF